MLYRVTCTNLIPNPRYSVWIVISGSVGLLVRAQIIKPDNGPAYNPRSLYPKPSCGGPESRGREDARPGSPWRRRAGPLRPRETGGGGGAAAARTTTGRAKGPATHIALSLRNTVVRFYIGSIMRVFAGGRRPHRRGRQGG